MSRPFLALLAFVCNAALFWVVQFFATPLFSVAGRLAGITLGTLTAAVVSGAVSLALLEGRKLTEIGLAPHPGARRNFVWGFALGLGGALLVVGVPIAIGLAHFESTPAAVLSTPAVLSLPILLFCGAIGEEIAFRGFALQVLMRDFGTWVPIIGMGALFGALHALNPGATLISTLNTAGFGILFGCALLRTHDLWLSTGIHFAWNTALPFLGVGLSGLTIEVTRYRLVWVSTRQIISGGDYGPEASLTASALLVVLFIAVWLLPVQRGRTCLLDPDMVDPPGTAIVMLAFAAAVVSGTFVTAAAAGVLHTADKLTEDEKISLVRDLSAEYAVVKSTIPRSRKPLEFSSDSTWDQKQWQKLSQAGGVAARLGDKVQITHVALDGDHLVLEINGGLKDGKKWYDHIEAGMGASTRPIAQTDATAKYGTSIDLDFHKPMESLTAADVKHILAPILEFDKRTVTQIYTETLPPKIREAITEKRAEVGMDRDEVQLALGHPDHKYRESKDGIDTEDWIYGAPPGKITFVTFTGTKVTRVKDAYAGLGLATSPN